MKKSTKLVTIALLISQALVLHLIEANIPNPLLAFAPGARLGLANIITLTTMIIFGFKEAMMVMLIRSFLGSMLGGNPIGFLYSVSGGILSTIAMGITYIKFRKQFSLMGVSVVGAVFHNIGQLLIAAIIIKNFGIYVYLPVMLLSAIVTGYFVGLTTQYLSKIINKHLKLS